MKRPLGVSPWPAGTLAALVVAACGTGPVDSGTISVTVNSMNESDIRTPGIVQKDKNIATQSGNPWGRFIDAAQAECARDPAGFEVRSVSIALDPASDIAAFQDVIDGAVTVYFSDVSGSDAAAIRADVGSTTAPTGVGPVALSVSGTRSSLNPLRARLVGGDFHVGVRAATSLTGADKFSMDIRVSLVALAYCD